MNYQMIDLLDISISKGAENDLSLLIKEGVLSTEGQIELNKLNLMTGAYAADLLDSITEAEMNAQEVIEYIEGLQEKNEYMGIGLPHEFRKGYKMKLDALKRQGARTDLTSAQVAQKLENKTSRQIIVEQTEEGPHQISRYIRLTELIPQLLDLVDDKKIAFNLAVELSYLDKTLQPKRRRDAVRYINKP